MTTSEKGSFQRWLQRVLAGVLIFAAQPAIEQSGASQRYQSAAVMRAAAQHFLESLKPEQAAKAKIAFHDEERMNWLFVPGDLSLRVARVFDNRAF